MPGQSCSEHLVNVYFHRYIAHELQFGMIKTYKGSATRAQCQIFFEHC
jgi:hypothetical protein